MFANCNGAAEIIVNYLNVFYTNYITIITSIIINIIIIVVIIMLLLS